MTMLAIESGVSSHVRFSPRSEKLPLSTCVSTQADDVVRVLPHQSDSEGFDLTQLLPGLMDFLQQGVMVVTQQLDLLYWNSKAEKICQHFASLEEMRSNLPTAIVQACSRLIKLGIATYPLLTEFRDLSGRCFHLRVYWLRSNQMDLPAQQLPIVILLEDRLERLQEEALLEQKRYGLTERETEIWMLLRQECSYQEIAQKLQISLNTVKTHLKNVYSKQRSYLAPPYFEQRV